MKVSFWVKHFSKYRIQPLLSAKHLIAFIVLSSIITFVTAQSSAYKIFIIGDSTVCNYAESKYPWAGWGQVLSYFFKSGSVVIENAAIGGRSSKSFYVEGRWTTNVKSQLKPGDYVFIQFGHNDRDYSKEERYADTTTYKSYLRLYVNESRDKGAIPVFVSPMNMNTWNGTSLREVFTERDKGADYRGAMINVAAELKVPFIDLEKKSAAFMKSVGQAYCTNYHFMGLQKSEYPNYPDGYSDGTHFQEMGAIINARMIAEGIRELSSTTEIGKLAAVLAPLNKVTVNPNKASTGLVTVSGDFPQGVTVTLKVMPNSGQTFQFWADAAGKNITTSKLYKFAMGNSPVTYNAMFQGGYQVAISGKNNPNHLPEINSITIDFKTSHSILNVNASSIIKSITIFDLQGNIVYQDQFDSKNASVNVKKLHPGVYCLKVHSIDSILRRNFTL